MAPMKLSAHKRLGNEVFDSYSLTHLAHMWHVPRRRIRKMLQRGELPFVEIGGRIRIPRAAVDSKLERSC